MPNWIMHKSVCYFLDQGAGIQDQPQYYAQHALHGYYVVGPNINVKNVLAV